MFKHAYLIYVLLFFALLGCKKDEVAPHPPGSVSAEGFTVLSDDVTDLYAVMGDAVESDTVVIYVQGGPIADLETNVFGSADDPTEDAAPLGVGRVSWVTAHQAQTYNANLYQQLTGLANHETHANAVMEDRLSALILDRVTRHFLGLSKTVFVVGHSFGAFIIPKTIELFGTPADRYLIMAGRLDMDAVVWEGARDCKIYTFPEDGETPPGRVPKLREDNSTVSPRPTKCAQTYLQAGLGFNRFTTALSSRSLSKVIYVSEEHDEAVGFLTSAEQTFLRTQGAEFICIPKGTHSTVFTEPYITPVAGALFGREGALEVAKRFNVDCDLSN